MATTTLAIVPSYSSEVDFTENATVVSFGDGYEQRTPTGINAKRLSFRLTWDRVTTQKAGAVVAFFRNVGNTQAFLWTPPPPYDAAPLQFVARPPMTHQWIAYDCETVTVAIDQDFNPLP